VETTREIVLRALAPKLRAAGIDKPDQDVNLVKLGIIDSSDLLEIIVLVEGETGREFNPEGLDLELGLTLGQLASAFGPIESKTAEPAGGSRHAA
jgi:acyl carrier protein